MTFTAVLDWPLPVKKHEESLSNAIFICLCLSHPFQREFYLVYKPSLAKMTSTFSHIMVEMMQIAIKCLNGSQTQGDGGRVMFTRGCLGHITYMVLHCLTSAHPCIQYSCGIQYTSCNFHCISDKDFFLLKKKVTRL